ncbi:hypothetical protein GGI07_001448 [Coemansia sp. Benny D115]|nr:hypothetical protein GGI07_001448 [Coemansia sp. Benny D115]
MFSPLSRHAAVRLFQPIRRPGQGLSRWLHTKPNSPSPTAALCVIGDEILNGKTQDTNSRVFAQKCFVSGAVLQKILVVGDRYDHIIDALQELSKSHDIVFTSGGIGPTHDDITYGALARAFGDQLAYHQETLVRMHRISTGTRADPHGTEVQRAAARMALLPSTAQVVYPCSHLWVPAVRVAGNVHVLPGIPRLFSEMLEAYLPQVIAEAAGSSGAQGFTRVLVATSLRESEIAPKLEALQEKYAARDISLGSYPSWPGPTLDGKKQAAHRVVLSAVGHDKVLLEAIRSELRELFNATDFAE